MLPRPESRALLGLDELAVDLFGIDEHNVAVVDLGLGVHKLKHASCARDSHDYRVDLLRDLAYVIGELLGCIEEGNYHADVDKRRDRVAENI